MKQLATRTLALACGALMASVVHAEVGLPPMNLGNTSFLDGIAAPGFLFELSTSYYRATRIRDNDGNAAPGSPRVETAAIVPHIAYISPDVTLLGGHLGGEVLLPLVYANIRPGSGTGDHDFAAGDIQFSPFIVQWTGQTLFGMPFFQRFDLLFSAPTGQYDANGMANAGTHLWTVTPYYAFTLMPTGKLEISGRLNYQWNGKNTRPAPALHASSVQPGDALYLNLSASYAISNGLRIGVAGYMLGQIGEDRIDGIRQSDSRERVFGAGPGILIQGDAWQVFLNAYKEWGARNRPQGSKIVLRVLAPF